LLTDFVIPADITDLQFLPVQNVCSVAGKGSLKFSVSPGYQLFANPLTSVEIPVAGPLAVKARGNAKFTFAVTISAGFKISVLKSSANMARLLVERSRDTSFDESMQINAQVTATVMGQDLLSLILSAISPDPATELKQINAKLDDAARDAINETIKSAIEDNFELATKAEFEQSIQNDTLFLYELDLSKLSETGKAALQNAFRGDFTKLSEAAATGQDGVSELRSVSTNTTTTSRKLTVHLLNVFQAGSASALISKETVKATPSGDLAITDAATARSTSFISLPGKADRLRNVLFTSAMITSAYKGTKTQLGAPDLTCELVHFHHDQTAGTSELLRNTSALAALGIVSTDQVAQALDRAKTEKSGASNINIRLKLSADDCARLFLDENHKARPATVYESAGKSAMYELIVRDPDQTALAKLLTSEQAGLWHKLKAADTLSQAAAALGNAADTMRAAPYFAEVSRIKWWTDHMSALAACVEAFRSVGSGLDMTSQTFQKLHKALNAEAKNVSALSEDYFNLPWGIVAISHVLDFSPKAEVTYVSQPLSLQVSAPEKPAAVTAAS
jgi:hypothetical protein